VKALVHECVLVKVFTACPEMMCCLTVLCWIQSGLLPRVIYQHQHQTHSTKSRHLMCTLVCFYTYSKKNLLIDDIILGLNYWVKINHELKQNYKCRLNILIHTIFDIFIYHYHLHNHNELRILKDMVDVLK
jgi:hypothetical protein